MHIAYSNRSSYSGGERWTAVFCFTVIVTLIVAFGILPIGELVWWSFTDREIGSKGDFVGFQNYLKVLSSAEYYRVLSQTLIYTIGSVLIKLLIGTILAMLATKLVMNSTERFLKWLVPVMLIPWAIPTVASMLVWSWILYDLGGLLNSLLRTSGFISSNVSWLGNHKLATACLVVVNVWRGTGFFFASILAARLSIPKQRYFVAWIEGASPLTVFRAITLPGMVPTLLIVTLISIINTYTDFQIVHILTDGGPGDSTQILSTMIYEYAFRGKSTLGYAAAFAISFAPFLLLTIILLLHFLSKNNSLRSNEIL